MQTISIFFIYFLPFICISNAYLSNTQWVSIQKIWIHKDATHNMKQELKNIVFNHHYNYTKSKAFQFKQKNKRFLKKVSILEIEQYAYKGLFKAINHYNGKNKFLPYADIYIHSELVRSISELAYFNILPHRYKVQTKYHHLLKQATVETFTSDEDILSSSIQDNINKKEIHDCIRLLNCDAKRCLYYRHGDHLDNNKLMPINKISQLMCCSEETVKLKLKCIYSILQSNNNKDSIYSLL